MASRRGVRERVADVLSRWDRGDIVFGAVLAGLLGLAVVPLLAVQLLPVQDTYLHEAIARVLHALRGDAAHPWADVFEVAPPLLRPNALYYWTCHLLGYLVPIEAVTRLLFVGYVVTLPLSLLLLFRTAGRSRWLVLLVLPFVYNAHVALGFVSYMIATPLYFTGVALTIRFLEAPRTARGIVLAGIGLLVLLAHAQMFLLLLVTQLVLGCCLPADRRARTGLAATSLPALLAFLPWYLKYFVEEAATATGVRFMGLGHLFGATWSRPEDFLAEVPKHVNGFFTSAADEIVLLAVAVLLLGGMAFRRRPAVEAPGWRHVVRAHVLELLTGLLVLLSVLLPSHIANQFVVRERHLLLAFLLLCGWFPWPRARAPHVVLAAALAVLSAAWFLTVRAELVAFDRAQQPMVRLLAQLPEKTHLGRIQGDRAPERMTWGAHWYIHAHAMTRRGVRTPLWFARYPGTPVQYRRGQFDEQPRLAFWEDERADAYDALLLYQPGWRPPPDLPPRFRLLGAEAGWFLFGVGELAPGR